MRTITTPVSESSMRAVRVSGTGRISYTGWPTARKWRNWQTHQLEGLAVAIPWGFESPLPHHFDSVIRADFDGRREGRTAGLTQDLSWWTRRAPDGTKPCSGSEPWRPRAAAL